MASNVPPLVLNSSKQDPLTVDGYREIFDECENISDVYTYLRTMYKEFSVRGWLNLLKANNGYEGIQCLDEYTREIYSKTAPANTDEYIGAVEVFSLLESVYRHALCRPYVPVYRSINMNCGQYRSYVKNREEALLQRLDFKTSAGNLLTYSEADPSKTVVCALTCSVFWGVINEKLEKEKSPPAPAARRKN